MEREEPRMGRPDLSSIEFREPIRINAVPEETRSLWWQVALGVFLALMAHSMIVGAYRRYEIREATLQLNADIKKMDAQWQREGAAAEQAIQRAAAGYPAAPSRARPAPLLDGQRCVQKRRFQRVENGWVHLPNEPC
ncbi:hypothetical protein [Pseudoxanthomonas wuyuanensis]|uniref:hypothetical protein n=1 Tax=Pseudoxanthomonas wuyuanensis TaxID=1073196 RepID=UPI001143D258|nr:hypothetical protein [Pseudoxanthomonas wuyuanensis]